MTPTLAVVTEASAIPWFVAASIAAGVWLVLFAIVARATLPALPDAGPETMDLAGEPPAVANFLVNRWEVTSSAIAATLLDLAGRRIVAIEQVGLDQHLVRLGRRVPDDLLPYEAKVLQLVRDKAVDGTVPARELSLGAGDHADAWWKSFRQQVIDHAVALGLTRRRWGPRVVALLLVTLTVPFLLLGGGIETLRAASRAVSATTDSNDAGGGLMMAGFGFLVVVGIGAKKLRGWRSTGPGMTAAARWLGVKAFLAHDDVFGDAPAPAVAIWDRYLAYGTALGVAAGAARSLADRPRARHRRLERVGRPLARGPHPLSPPARVRRAARRRLGRRGGVDAAHGRGDGGDRQGAHPRGVAGGGRGPPAGGLRGTVADGRVRGGVRHPVHRARA